MASDFQLSIVSPAREVYQGPALAAVVPAKEGSMGILPGHAPVIAILGSGLVKFRTEEGEQSYFLSGGFLEIKSDRVSVLADEIMDPSEISAEAAQKDLEELRAKSVAGEEAIEAHMDKLQGLRSRIAAASENS
ncbi:MAG: ATP synthase F1 subunit epsilon [Leptospiraceae bacterium]|nr:ATP synthase F1 subunit epsilon [Leptospiraceae bacterium]